MPLAPAVGTETSAQRPSHCALNAIFRSKHQRLGALCFKHAAMASKRDCGLAANPARTGRSVTPCSKVTPASTARVWRLQSVGLCVPDRVHTKGAAPAKCDSAQHSRLPWHFRHHNWRAPSTR